MKNITILENEHEHGDETREDVLVFISEKNCIRISNDYYTGVIPDLYVGKSITIEPIAEKPHDIGYESRQYAESYFRNNGYMDVENQTIDSRTGIANLLFEFFEGKKKID